MIKKITDTRVVAKLFEGWENSLIWSCIQDVMGNIYAPDCENPESAMASLGGFCFLTGKPVKELVGYKPRNMIGDFITMVPQNDSWGKLIEDCYGEMARSTMRYAIKKEPYVFDQGKLQQIVDSLQPFYTLQMMDEPLYNYCRSNRWSYELVSQYLDYGVYKELGIGVMVLREGEPVSGASSYTSYRKGIEIEIDTKETYRRQGLASVCGAKLILECLKRGLYPSWDAQNVWSIALAEKLGYHFDREYVVYEVMVS